MNRNLCKKVLSEGGSLVPLLISSQDSKGLGLMNPSVLLDETKILLNLRNINYTLYHSENNQGFINRFGPLAYLHPENDMHLRTYNFYCELDPEKLNITRYHPIDTSTFDQVPLWDFVGLEDARLFRWEGKLYTCGVRRDTTPNGEGRMELCEIIEKDASELKEGESPIKEISRIRIEPPGDHTYCEKNWMPILDMPYHFVKWCNPTQVVKVNLRTKTSETVFLGASTIPNIPDFRGSSQVIKYKEYRICLIHEVNLFRNKLEQKDATYLHRFLVWDKDWNLVKMSDVFSFMDGEIEFCCGMALYKKDLLITFGFQDNAAFLLRVPEKLIDEIIGFKRPEFDWGAINKNEWFKNTLKYEIFQENSYQKFFEVEKDDVVVDVGASVGPFTYAIMPKKPKRVFCIEPSKELFPTLIKNTKNTSAICINKGITDKNGKIVFKGLFNTDSAEMWSSKEEAESMTFDKFIKDYNISKIDFLKLDCEGGEYDILNEKNSQWIINNVKKIAGEFHIHNDELKEKFSKFRETYLKKFTNYQVFAMDGTDIKWDLFNDHFLLYYAQFMIYIDNRPPAPEPKQIIPFKPEIIKSESKPKKEKKETKKEKWETAKWPTFEITTNILSKGCVMTCAFCPQKTLTNAYKGKRMLTLPDFKKTIDKIPKEITIVFSGFSEPFLNKQCTDMILYAHEKGHRISIFTTGIGMDIEDFDQIKNISFTTGPENPVIGRRGTSVNNNGFILHIPDNEGFSHHPITEKYIKLLEHINAVKDTIPGFNINCFGTPHDKIKHIFPTAPSMEIWARANNLLKEEKLRPEIVDVIKNKYKTSEIGSTPASCLCDEKLYHNVLLPNGDVVLCCMDYNLDNVLGNIFEKTYEDIIPEPESLFELCRTCENSYYPENKK
jgi:FkbM family methyltransferase